MPDIDIDFADRNLILEKIHYRSASLENGKKHNTGIYVTEIPYNPISKISTIPYKIAEDRGYFKLDFLNVSLYKLVKNKEHLDTLIDKEPVWELLEYEEFTNNLFHISGHHKICQVIKPKSVYDVAIVLALIRPAKKHLIHQGKDIIEKEIWRKPDDGSYYFKKAHAISYAMAVKIHMNLLCEDL